MNYSVAYWDKPKNVVWVDLGHRQLRGFDHYWIAGQRYGCYNDPENMGTMYRGLQAVAWKYLRGVETELEDPTPPPGATIFDGFMLTDEQARFVGLI